MKILKWILIIIGIIIAAVLTYSATLPSQMKIEESITINTGSDKIFETVTNFPNWGEWSYWSMIDSNMRSEYSETMGEVGSSSQWWSNHPMVGNGRQEVVEIRENEYMKVEMSFDGQEGKPNAEFILEPQEEGTLVRWTFIGPETPFYMRWGSKLFEPMLRESYQSSLKNLKGYLESMPSAPIMPEGAMLEEISAQMIISVLDSTTGEGISAKLTEMYTELSIFVESRKQLNMSGMPLAIYHSYSPERVIMEGAFPVAGIAESAGRVKVGTIPAGMVIKGIHYGDYAASEGLHNAIYDYIEASEYQMSGSPWEVYANDPTTVDSAAVETHIYYPVSK